MANGSVAVPVGPNPRSIAAGDFNGDGRPDLAVADHGGTTTSILLGRPAGIGRVPTMCGADSKTASNGR